VNSVNCDSLRKPQNILLKFDANCAVHLVLADLGLARMWLGSWVGNVGDVAVMYRHGKVST
jgi:hypothetical protein